MTFSSKHFPGYMGTSYVHHSCRSQLWSYGNYATKLYNTLENSLVPLRTN